MATNPMQRKARNSFLLGMLTTLVVSAIIIVLLFLQLSQLKSEQAKLEKMSKTVCVVNKEIKSGQPITASDVKTVTVTSEAVPSDSITSVATLGENVLSKINLKAGTVLSSEMLQPEDEQTVDDLRLQEYNMINIPTHLKENDYIDIRLQLPSGQDYIVVSKKRVIQTSETSTAESTIWIQLTEEEILTMSNAIVEAYKIPGSNLYATTYVEPGIQNNASTTYTVSAEVLKLINSDANIRNEARQGLWDRYNKVSDQRNVINDTLNANAENAQDNVQQKMEDQVTRSKEQRKEVLDTLSGM